MLNYRSILVAQVMSTLLLIVEQQMPAQSLLVRPPGEITLREDSSSVPVMDSSSIKIAANSFYGALSVSIPFALPAARGRCLPDLTLNYSDLGGDGEAGLGWRLVAGVISRSENKSGVNYLANDFVLNLGNISTELTKVGDHVFADRGGMVRLEAIEVPSPNGSFWRVTDAFGTKYFFGLSSASRVTYRTEVNEWYLDKIVDRSGNYSSLSYQANGQMLYLTTLEYSGNRASNLVPRNRIEVVYENRPVHEVFESYKAFYLQTNSLRVHQLNVSARGKLYSSYTFQYTQSAQTGRSLLASVTRAIGGVSLPPVTMSYSDRISVERWQSQPATSGPIHPGLVRLVCLPGDFDGDGREDLACATDSSGTWNVGLSLGSANSNNSQSFNGFNTQSWIGPVVGKSKEITLHEKTFSIPDVPGSCFAADFNGDNRTDIACFDSSAGEWDVGLSSGTGFDTKVWDKGPLPVSKEPGSTLSPSDMCVTGDFDGDGRSDLACDIPGLPEMTISLSTGTGWKTSSWAGSPPGGWIANSCVVGDFNGDRREDLACYKTIGQWEVYLSQGVAFYSDVWANGPDPSPPSLFSNRPVSSQCLTGDFNGDGKTDIACYGGRNGSDTEFDGIWSLGLSTGDAWHTVQRAGVPVFERVDGENVSTQCLTGDFNGDGKTDIACMYGDEKRVEAYWDAHGITGVWGECISGGDAFDSSMISLPITVVPGYDPALVEENSCVYGDFTGDEKTDLLCDRGTTDQYFLNSSDFRPPDLMTSLTEPSGLKAHFNYGSSGAETGSVMGGSLWLLKESSLADGSNTSVTNYDYSGGYFNKAAKEYRGFNHATVIHPADRAGRRLIDDVWYHQGDELDPGANDPSDVAGTTAGLPYREVAQDANKNVFVSVDMQYGMQSPTPGFSVARLGKRRISFSQGHGNVDRDTTFEYDANGNVTGVSDVDLGGSGLTVKRRFTYSNDRNTGVIAFPLTAEVSDSRFGRLRYTEYEYDGAACGLAAPPKNSWQLTKVKRWLSNSASGTKLFAHSGTGDILCVEDEKGAKTTISYDADEEYSLAVENALGQKTLFEYYGINGAIAGVELPGALESVTNVAGDKTAFDVDPFGRVVGMTSPDSSTNTTTYNLSGDPTEQYVEVTASGITHRRYLDGLDRTYRSLETAPEGKSTVLSSIYDGVGNLVAASAPNFDAASSQFSRMEYDELSRELSLIEPNGNTWRTCYDGLRADRLDPRGYHVRDTSDVFGNRVAREEFSQPALSCDDLAKLPSDPPSVTKTYDYDGVGQLRQVKIADSVVSSIDYDGAGNIVHLSNIDSGDSVFSYDVAARLASSLDASGRRSEYERDLVGRVVSVTARKANGGGRETRRFTYDDGPHARGRLTGALTSGFGADKSRASYSYDANGDIVQEVTQNGGKPLILNFSWDALGRIAQMTYPDGRRVLYQYDGPALKSIGDGQTAWFSAQNFDAYFAPQRILFGNGSVEENAYGGSALCPMEPIGYLCITATSLSGKPILSLSYAYDAALDVATVTELSTKLDLAYDPAARLTSESSASSVTAYTYDALGRRASTSFQGGYRYDHDTATAKPSLPSAIGVLSLDGDKSGKLTRFGKTKYSYDAFGQLSRVTVPSSRHWWSFLTFPNRTTIEYSYDWTGNVARRATARNYVLGIPFIRSISHSSMPFVVCESTRLRSGFRCRDNVYGYHGLSATVLNDGTEYYHLDRVGTARAISTSAGSTRYLSYSAFGAPKDEQEARNFFAGHLWDKDARLYRFGYRFYDPTSGLFTAPDSDSRIASGQIASYAYAFHNPLRWMDPDGRQEVGFGGGNISISIGDFRFGNYSGPSIGPINFGGGGPIVDFRPGGGTGFSGTRTSSPSTSFGAYSGDAIATDAVFNFATEAFAGPLGRGIGAGAESLLGVLTEAEEGILGQSFGKLGTVVKGPGLSISGFSKHGLNQTITRGVSPQSLLGTVNNPAAVFEQSTGRFLYLSDEAAVVLDPGGRVVTSYPASLFDSKINSIVDLAK